MGFRSVQRLVYAPLQYLKTSCPLKYAVSNLEHCLLAFTFTHSAKTNTLQSPRVKCFAQGPKCSSMAQNINPRAIILSSCFYFYLFMISLQAKLLRHSQFIDTFSRNANLLLSSFFLLQFSSDIPIFLITFDHLTEASSLLVLCSHATWRGHVIRLAKQRLAPIWYGLLEDFSNMSLPFKAHKIILLL